MKNTILLLISAVFISLGCSSSSDSPSNNGNGNEMSYGIEIPGAGNVEIIDAAKYYDVPLNADVRLYWVRSEEVKNWSMFIDTITESGAALNKGYDASEEIEGKDVYPSRCLGSNGNLTDFSNIIELRIKYTLSNTGYAMTESMKDSVTNEPSEYNVVFGNGESRKTTIRIRYCSERCSEIADPFYGTENCKVINFKINLP